MRKYPVLQWTLAAVLVGLSTAAVGCSSDTKPKVPDTGTPNGPGTMAVSSAKPSSTPLPAQPAVKPQGNGSSSPADSGTGTPTASNEGSGGSGESPSTGKNVAASSDTAISDNKPATPPAEPYTVKKPSLMGVSLTDTLTSVAFKLGKPENEYTMEDETDPITAYEYKGFVVGFNKAKIVQFIEITTSDVNPGLNGFKLGQTAKEAVDALGKPDSSTKYAMSYKSSGTILKLDVDPTTQAVLSIKLFADQTA